MKLSSRKELLRQAEIELSRIREITFKEPVARHGVEYERWGHYIYDPDISKIDYRELRKKDPTLPKKDPRGWKIFRDERSWDLEPYQKWLYFSDELGSYAKREKLYYGIDNQAEREKLIRRLDPTLLTKKQKQQSRKFYNTPELKKQLPKSFIELVSSKEKWEIAVRYVLASFLDAIEPD